MPPALVGDGFDDSFGRSVALSVRFLMFLVAVVIFVVVVVVLLLVPRATGDVVELTIVAGNAELVLFLFGTDEELRLPAGFGWVSLLMTIEPTADERCVASLCCVAVVRVDGWDVRCAADDGERPLLLVCGGGNVCVGVVLPIIRLIRSKKPNDSRFLRVNVWCTASPTADDGSSLVLRGE